MLPTIDLDFAQMCAPAFDVNNGRHTFVGNTFACYLEPLRAAAIEAKKSLDRLITEAVLAGITERPPRSKALFWYTPGNDMIFLTGCDKHQRFRPMWLRNLPGYFECGSDFVHPNSRPYLYWNGANLTRIYLMDEPPQKGKKYLSDLGALFGALVGVGDEYAVEQVRASDPEYVWYSLVPDEPDEIIVIGNRKCILCHSFCTLTNPPVPDDDLPEDEYA